MVSELTEYFVRHYTLVLDNDQESYNATVRAAKRVLLKDGISLSEYKALSSQERRDRFAAEIGDEIMSLINSYFTEMVTTDSIGGMLAHEVMILASSDVEWHLGDHYMPEVSDAEEYLTDDEDDE